MIGETSLTEDEPSYTITPKGERVLRIRDNLSSMIIEQRKEAYDLLGWVQFYIESNQWFEAATYLVDATDLIEEKGVEGIEADSCQC